MRWSWEKNMFLFGYIFLCIFGFPETTLYVFAHGFWFISAVCTIVVCTVYSVHCRCFEVGFFSLVFVLIFVLFCKKNNAKTYLHRVLKKCLFLGFCSTKITFFSLSTKYSTLDTILMALEKKHIHIQSSAF